ncbi:MAG: enoyl-CoA delta isomerase 1 [Hyphomicrobiales bacterium]|nr:enoyl-CoA delta isomerase 1 [Hyphomicrobiales bacterium]
MIFTPSSSAFRNCPARYQRSQGAAAGGGFCLAIGADIIIADETAKFTPDCRSLGTTPDGGGSFFLPRTVGLNKAMEMFLAGGTYSARDAKEMGLVGSVVAASELGLRSNGKRPRSP